MSSSRTLPKFKTRGIVFDPEAHSYEVKGVRVPSVTQVINDVIPRTFHAEPWHLRRGQMVHLAIELELNGRLDWSSVDERIKGRVEAALAFLRDCRLDMVETEMRVAGIGYAGTVDFLGIDRSGNWILADWKGTIEATVQLQLAAYREALRVMSTPHLVADRAAAVELSDSGKYKVRWIESKQLNRAVKDFLACLTVYNWKRKNNK